MDAPLEKIISLIHNVRFGGLPTHYPSIAAWGTSAAAPLDAARAWKACFKKQGGRRPAGIYLNVPFCRAKCGFCFLDIVPASGPAAARQTELFMRAAEAEMRLVSGLFPAGGIGSVYIGGGTPNILTAAQLGRLLAGLRASFDILPGAQISMEANPDLLDQAKLGVLAAGGVSLLMLGIQSFSPAVNAASGRVQDVSRIKKTFSLIRAAGIKEVNADLLCGLPAQTEKSFLSDVEKLASFRPSQIHLNRIKPLRGNLEPARKAALTAWQAAGLRLLERRGYKALDEESASLGGAHNIQGDYKFQVGASLIGLGPGALSHAWGAMRYQNLSSLGAYAEASLSGRLPVMRGIKITAQDELRHFLLNELLHGAEVSGASVAAAFGSAGAAFFLKLAAGLSKAGALRRRGSAYACPLESGDWLRVTAALYAEKHLKNIAGMYFPAAKKG
ncbi:MAG TPA: radical SAM protein [Elusimicrobiales bacterium]|nr:radical SAM protein [Elusimicrobiales bacterium]